MKYTQIGKLAAYILTALYIYYMIWIAITVINL